MEFSELIKQRQSCRKFDDTKRVSIELLRECLDEASLSPSACNAQPYSVEIVVGERFTQAVKGIQDAGMNRFADKASAMYVIFEEKGTLISGIGEALKNRSFTATDIGILAAHLTLSLKNKGVDSCIIGWINEKTVCSVLNVNKKIGLIVLAGYAEEGYPVREKKRRSLTD